MRWIDMVQKLKNPKVIKVDERVMINSREKQRKICKEKFSWMMEKLLLLLIL